MNSAASIISEMWPFVSFWRNFGSLDFSDQIPSANVTLASCSVRTTKHMKLDPHDACTIEEFILRYDVLCMIWHFECPILIPVAERASPTEGPFVLYTMKPDKNRDAGARQLFRHDTRPMWSMATRAQPVLSKSDRYHSGSQMTSS